MTKKSMFFVLLVSVCAGSAFAAGSSPSALAAGVNVQSRRNAEASNGLPLTKEAKGVKVFGADQTATLVTDEKAVVAISGGLASLEIGAIAPFAVPSCYLMVFDSSVAADTTEAGSVSRMLVPPLVAVTSSNQIKELAYPKQFHKGLVVLIGGAGAAGCRASIGWNKNGGNN